MSKQTKMDAKKAMLKELSNKRKGEIFDGLGKDLKSKKAGKVTVVAKDKEGLEEGLSMAQKLLKAKFGELKEKAVEEEDEDCPVCEGEGCSECSYEEEEEDESVEE
jgi:hypothetical protein